TSTSPRTTAASSASVRRLMNPFSVVVFHDGPPTEISTLSLHDALPILLQQRHVVPLTERNQHPLDAARLHRDLPVAQHRGDVDRSEEHTSELQSRENLVCRLLLEKKKCMTHVPCPPIEA